jgi:hypothetical protein
MAVRPITKPSDTLRCGRPMSLGRVEDSSGEMFSGCKIGHFSDVGLPDSASTSVRWAFGGLAGVMICATGGLGSGLLQLGVGSGLLQLGGDDTIVGFCLVIYGEPFLTRQTYWIWRRRYINQLIATAGA